MTSFPSSSKADNGGTFPFWTIFRMQSLFCNSLLLLLLLLVSLVQGLLRTAAQQFCPRKERSGSSGASTTSLQPTILHLRSRCSCFKLYQRTISRDSSFLCPTVCPYDVSLPLRMLQSLAEADNAVNSAGVCHLESHMLLYQGPGGCTLCGCSGDKGAGERTHRDWG